MKVSALCFSLAVAVAAARSPQHVGKKLPERRFRSMPEQSSSETKAKVEKRQSSRFMTDRTASASSHTN